jgi:predicted oxidoreductase
MAAAARTYERYVTQYRNDVGLVMEAQQKLADHARARGAVSDRTRWLQQVVAVDRGADTARTARTRTLAAAASLELAAPARDAYNAVKLTIPLKKSLAAKRATLEKALKAYEAAGAYGIAEVATAATFETGELKPIRVFNFSN